MVATACPAAEHLREFVLGHLHGSAAAALDAHLAQCAQCSEAIAHLDGDDELTASMRSLGQTALPRNHLIEQLRSQVRSFRPPAATLLQTLENVAAPAGPRPLAAGLAPVRRTDTPQAMPHHVGRYRILERLGAGGMGTVYKAHDPQLHRVVAVKVPRFDGSQAFQEQSRQRFLREARVAAGVRHPHVCPIYDVGEQDDVPYVVMACVEGESLADRLRAKGRFEDCREAVAMIRQVGEGLAAVHAVNIIHRDLKPGNILLDRATGQPLLTDFGLARVLTEGEHITADGSLLGTPAYMSPEQATIGGDAVGAPSDQYSLAVVLYQMVTGRLPFEGSTVAVLNQIGNKVPPPASQFRADLDPKLVAILRTAMARRPEERYPTVQAFLGALTAWLRSAAQVAAAAIKGKHQPAESLTMPPPLPSAEDVTAAHGAMAPSPAAEGTALPETVALSRVRALPRRRRAVWIPVAAGLLLVVLGVAGWGLFHRSNANKDNTEVVNADSGKSRGNSTDWRGNPAPPDDPPISAAVPVRERAKIEGVTTWDIVADNKEGLFSRLALSPDGSELLLRRSDSSWIAWNLKAGERGVAPFAGHFDSLSADGQLAAARKSTTVMEIGQDPAIPQWNTTLRVPPSYGITGDAWLSPNGEWAAAPIAVNSPGNYSHLSVWSLRLSNPTLRMLGGPVMSFFVIRSPWGVRPGQLIVPSRGGNGDLLEFLAVEDDGKQVILRQIKSLGHGSSLIFGGTLDPDGKRYASLVQSADGNECWIWDLETEEHRVLPKTTWASANPPVWSPSGSRLACLLRDSSAQIGVFDVSSGELLYRIDGHPFGTTDMLFTPDARTVVTTGGDSTVRFWDARNGQLRGTLMLLPENQWLATSPDGNYKGSSDVVGKKLFTFQVRETGKTKLRDVFPTDFEKEFGWKNDPSKVNLLGP